MMVKSYSKHPFTAHYTYFKIPALLAEAARNKHVEFRTYRVEKNYAVSAGKW